MLDGSLFKGNGKWNGEQIKIIKDDFTKSILIASAGKCLHIKVAFPDIVVDATWTRTHTTTNNLNTKISSYQRWLIAPKGRRTCSQLHLIQNLLISIHREDGNNPKVNP